MLAGLGLGVLLVVGAVVVVIAGGTRERQGMAIVAVVSVASLLMPWVGPVPAAVGALLILDCLALVVLGRLAWKAPKNWPLWVMAPQSMAAAASLAFLLQDDAGTQTYLRALLLARYAAALLLLFGMARRQQAQP